MINIEDVLLNPQLLLVEREGKISKRLCTAKVLTKNNDRYPENTIIITNSTCLSPLEIDDNIYENIFIIRDTEIQGTINAKVSH